MRLTKIMIVAGEASGDLHGAKLAEAIKKEAPRVFLFGVGGPGMRAQGVDIVVDINRLSVMGITEVVSKLPTIYQSLSTVKKAIRRLKPDLVVTIDFPDFNFQVATFAKSLNIPVLYYISPQIWAWRQGRVKKIKRMVDHMAVIFPFEAAFYRKHKVPVTFVGHPFLDRRVSVPLPPSESDLKAHPVIGLLPGSREKEASSLLPTMVDACRPISRALTGARFLVSRAHSIEPRLIQDIIEHHGQGLDLEVIDGPVEQVITNSHLIVAASGTVTLEAALHGVPTIIVYKVSPTSYWLGKRLIKVKHIGIVNLIAQKEIMPELIQEDVSPRMIAAEITRLASDYNAYMLTRNALLNVRKRLGEKGASQRLARIALSLCANRRSR